mmetsp:Transcript_28854/g.97264  ORF Transcript_28854/g.97264 Transcript_28854/m.97264 type:complete len:202 (+) Transcript_28854:1527-2132(+)
MERRQERPMRGPLRVLLAPVQAALLLALASVLQRRLCQPLGPHDLRLVVVPDDELVAVQHITEPRARVESRFERRRSTRHVLRRQRLQTLQLREGHHAEHVRLVQRVAVDEADRLRRLLGRREFDKGKAQRLALSLGHVEADDGARLLEDTLEDADQLIIFRHRNRRQVIHDDDGIVRLLKRLLLKVVALVVRHQRAHGRF